MTKHKFNVFLFVLGIFLVIFFFKNSANIWIYLAFVFAVFFLVLSAGVLFLRFSYFLPTITKTDKNFVLLTFDDGPNPETTTRILEILAQYQAKAIFFVIGKKAEKHPEIIEAILKDGHLIGNHTFTHPPLFALMSAKRVKEELTKMISTVPFENNSAKLFRPPIGYSNPIIARVVKKMKWKVVGWNVRSYDTVFRKNIGALNRRLLRLTIPGSIVLLHDNLPQTAQVLPLFLKEAQQKGIVFANQKELKIFDNENS